MWQVIDVRSLPRLLNSVPFRPGPSLLRFHPKFSSTLLIGSEAGIFTLSDIQGTAPGPTYQVPAMCPALPCPALLTLLLAHLAPPHPASPRPALPALPR